MNVQLENVQFLHVTNDPMPDIEKHYVTLFVVAKSTETPVNMEPEKCEGWRAYQWQELQVIATAADQRRQAKTGDPPENDPQILELFGPLERLIQDDPFLLHQKISEFTRETASVVAPHKRRNV